jgi:hypothetical protein
MIQYARRCDSIFAPSILVADFVNSIRYKRSCSGGLFISGLRPKANPQTSRQASSSSRWGTRRDALPSCQTSESRYTPPNQTTCRVPSIHWAIISYRAGLILDCSGKRSRAISASAVGRSRIGSRIERCRLHGSGRGLSTSSAMTHTALQVPRASASKPFVEI